MFALLLLFLIAHLAINPATLSKPMEVQIELDADDAKFVRELDPAMVKKIEEADSLWHLSVGAEKGAEQKTKDNQNFVERKLNSICQNDKNVSPTVAKIVCQPGQNSSAKGLKQLGEQMKDRGTMVLLTDAVGAAGQSLQKTTDGEKSVSKQQQCNASDAGILHQFVAQMKAKNGVGKLPSFAFCYSRARMLGLVGTLHAQLSRKYGGVAGPNNQLVRRRKRSTETGETSIVGALFALAFCGAGIAMVIVGGAKCAASLLALGIPLVVFGAIFVNKSCL